MVLVVALVGISVLEGVLKADGVRNSIVYGIYPPTAQLSSWVRSAHRSAGREEWPQFGVAIAIMAVATASAFAGPVGGVRVSATAGVLIGPVLSTNQLTTLIHAANVRLAVKLPGSSLKVIPTATPNATSGIA